MCSGKGEINGAVLEKKLKDNLPGQDWMVNFKKKWNHRLCCRKPEVLAKARAASLD